VDKDALVELLNQDLAMEFRSIVQYVQHFAIVKGPEYQGAIMVLQPHLQQELHHATVLAEQIDFLGGIPTTRVPDVPSESETEAGFKLDLELEERQLAGYRERVEQAEEAGLPDVAEALRPLLEQTQDHVRDLRSVLGVESHA
jgi:bacterioferritin